MIANLKVPQWRRPFTQLLSISNSPLANGEEGKSPLGIEPFFIPIGWTALQGAVQLPDSIRGRNIEAGLVQIEKRLDRPKFQDWNNIERMHDQQSQICRAIRPRQRGIALRLEFSALQWGGNDERAPGSHSRVLGSDGDNPGDKARNRAHR